jgi:hypothetical protein
LRSDRAAPLVFRIGRKPLARLLAVALVAAGFIFQGLLPGLDMALRGESLPFALVLQTGICHSPLTGASEHRTAPVKGGGGGQSESHGCCLVCQAASAAKGALPSPTFTVPTAGTAGLQIAAIAQALADGQASHHTFARGPPGLAA